MNQEGETLDECCSFEHKGKIPRGYISKSIRRTRLKFSPWESTAMITLCAKFNRNLRCRVLFRDFLVDLSWNAPLAMGMIAGYPGSFVRFHLMSKMVAMEEIPCSVSSFITQHVIERHWLTLWPRFHGQVRLRTAQLRLSAGCGPISMVWSLTKLPG